MTDSRSTQSTTFCPICNKLIGADRKGSLTGWIFGGNTCSCTLRLSIPKAARFGEEWDEHVQPDKESSDDRSARTEAPSRSGQQPSAPQIRSGPQARSGQQSRSGHQAYSGRQSHIEKADTDENVLTPRYTLRAVIERGGMSEVFKAWDNHLERDCVAKVMRSDLVNFEKSAQRFTTEARLCARFSHPNLVPVTDCGVSNRGRPFLIMDLIDGSSLRAVLDTKPQLSETEIFGIIKQICRGLQYAHEMSVVHRDLKPENILVAMDESNNPLIKIIDFGIARTEPDGGEIQRLTATGEVFGSAKYMSPEQCLGRPIDRRVDVYAVGCVAFEMLAGHAPFRGSNLLEVLNKHINEPAPSLKKSTKGTPLSPAANAIVAKCLQKEPDQRYQSMQEIIADIEKSIVTRVGTTTEAWKTAVGSAILTILIGALVFWISGYQLSNNTSDLATEYLLTEFTSKNDFLKYSQKHRNQIMSRSELNKLSLDQRCVLALMYIDNLFQMKHEIPITDLDGEKKKYDPVLGAFERYAAPVLDEVGRLESPPNTQIRIAAPLLYTYEAASQMNTLKLPKAKQNYEAGIDLAKRLDSPPWVSARLHNGLGSLYLWQKDYENAMREYSEAIRLFKSEATTILKDDVNEPLSKSIMSLYRAMIKANKREEAEKLLIEEREEALRKNDNETAQKYMDMLDQYYKSIEKSINEPR